MQRYRAALAMIALLLGLSPPAKALAQDDGPSDPEFQRLIYVELLLGGGWPIGDANVALDPSFMAGGRAEMQVTPTIRAGLELGFHSFDAELPAIRDNQGALALSLFGKMTGVWGPYRPFALFGLGAVNSKSDDATRRWDLGLQVGGGAEASLSEHVAILIGSSLHVVPRGQDEIELLWITGYMGFVFRQP